MTNWRLLPLSDVATVYDGPHATPTKTEDGPWYLSISSLQDGRFDLSASARLSPDDLPRWTKRVAPQPGDTLFSYETRIGQAAHWSLDLPAALGRRMGLLRPKPDRVDPRYLTYAYLGPQFQEIIRTKTVHGATVERLLISDMPRWPIAVPPVEEQRRIASVLGALDDLIASEERTASLADALWRAVVASELGHHDTLPLASLASFVNGKNFTKGGGELGLPVIRTPEVRTGPTSSTVRNDVPAAEDNIAQAGDILFVWSGSLLVSRWRWQPGLVNQHIFKVLPAAGVPDWLVLWAIEELMEDFLGVAADKATTMGHIKRGDLERPVAVPARSRWEALDARIRPFWDEADASRIHASELARARDELLPLLISGKLRVSEDLAVA